MAKEAAVATKEPTLSELTRRTDKENPRPEDVEMIRAILDREPSLIDVNAAAAHAFARVVATMSNKSFLVKELCDRNIQKRRSEMNYDNENAMVRMLIDNVILCQLRMTSFEAFHAERTQTDHTMRQGLYFDKLLTGYHRRFAKACEALASVKRLLCEAELLSQRAKNKRGQSTLQSAALYKTLSGS